MPPAIRTPIVFYCRGCWGLEGKKSKFKGYKSQSTTHVDVKYIAAGLKRHISHNSECYSVYKSQNLIKGRDINFSTSIREQTSIPPIHHSPTDFGLTMVTNGPSLPSHFTNPNHGPRPSANNLHSVLNRQVIHDVFVPPKERNIIESHMAASAQDNDDFGGNEGNTNDNSDGDGKCTFDNSSNTTQAQEKFLPPLSQPTNENIDFNHREKEQQNHIVLQPSHQLLAEVELMNRMTTKHKLSLSTFTSIWTKWAEKSQNRIGVDYSYTTKIPVAE